MEVLATLFFIVILLLILSLKSNLQNRLGSMEVEIRKLREQLAAPLHTAPIEQPLPPPVETFPQPPKEEWTSNFTVIEEKSLSQDLEAILANAENTKEQQPFVQQEKNEKTVANDELPAALQQPAVKEKRPSFMERNPDLEKFIGENLISKIGIAILVLAIGFFVKYAIDNDWIGAVGRVGIGILCGGILVAVAHRLRNSYKAFSSVLTGGGLAIFYFTITLAYHQFHLFSQIVAFIVMVVITAFAVALSQLYNRQELAIIALIGGFATPFMVSSGSGNYKSLFPT